MTHSKLLVGSTTDIRCPIYIQKSVQINMNPSAHISYARNGISIYLVTQTPNLASSLVTEYSPALFLLGMNTAISLNPPSWGPVHTIQPSVFKGLVLCTTLSATSWGPVPNHNYPDSLRVLPYNLKHHHCPENPAAVSCSLSQILFDTDSPV